MGTFNRGQRSVSLFCAPERIRERLDGTMLGLGVDGVDPARRNSIGHATLTQRARLTPCPNPFERCGILAVTRT